MIMVATEDRSGSIVDRIPMFINATTKRNGPLAESRQGDGRIASNSLSEPDKPAEPAVRMAGPDELAWIAEQSRRLEGRSPEEILTWAVQQYFPRFTMATGLGPEGCVIISMLAKIEPRVYVFNLDTGYQFRETLELRERINEKYAMPIHLERPEQSVTDYEASNDGPVYRSDPDRCCRDRKVRVLQRVAARFHAWATG